MCVCVGRKKRVEYLEDEALGVGKDEGSRKAKLAIMVERAENLKRNSR